MIYQDPAMAKAIETILAPFAKMVAQELANNMQLGQHATDAASNGNHGKRFYSVGELADELGISESLIYALIRKGHVEVHEFGSRKVLNINDVLAAGKMAGKRREDAEADLVAATRRRPGRPRRTIEV